ncbi:rhomboid family intramembrane serine protease [Paenibacillus sp. YN15]|uniref:rhomboid family intramembrane serine protease n=1 Tax=Paenibacillus sp. YN15 TaxID=1742774 RepID=UPI000DCCD719|nr:rhomboid family intramembrane serine protease [Paenibacillus sp. YN15]RAU96358.1 rhomboid family intramembrane serine protease [Paenibacillus sp. YN15]
MIFLRRETFKQYLQFYPVTSAILGIVAVLFAAMEITGSSNSIRTLLDFGAMYSNQGETHEWWRYISSMFLHIGFSHVLFNAFALYVFAPPLERLLGKFHYAAFFLLSGLVGNAFSMLFTEPPFIAAGASGAIYGIYAAYLYLALFHRHVLDEGTRTTVIMIVVMGAISSIVIRNVNLYAHLGGFLTGFAYFAVLTRRLRRRRS